MGWGARASHARASVPPSPRYLSGACKQIKYEYFTFKYGCRAFITFAGIFSLSKFSNLNRNLSTAPIIFCYCDVVHARGAHPTRKVCTARRKKEEIHTHTDRRYYQHQSFQMFMLLQTYQVCSACTRFVVVFIYAMQHSLKFKTFTHGHAYVLCMLSSCDPSAAWRGPRTAPAQRRTHVSPLSAACQTISAPSNWFC